MRRSLSNILSYITIFTLLMSNSFCYANEQVRQTSIDLTPIEFEKRSINLTSRKPFTLSAEENHWYEGLDNKQNILPFNTQKNERIPQLVLLNEFNRSQNYDNELLPFTLKIVQ